MSGVIDSIQPKFLSTSTWGGLGVLFAASIAAIALGILSKHHLPPVKDIKFKWTVSLWAGGGALLASIATFLFVRKFQYATDLKHHQAFLDSYRK